MLEVLSRLFISNYTVFWTLSFSTHYKGRSTNSEAAQQVTMPARQIQKLLDKLQSPLNKLQVLLDKLQWPLNT